MVLAPMQVYMGRNGAPTDHQHLARFALGGFGTVFTEALIVSPEGRNTYGDLGIWSDDFIAPLHKIANMLGALGVTPATQLLHRARSPAQSALALHAVQELGGNRSWSLWPPQYGRWLSRGAEQLALGTRPDTPTRK
jgi:2,4-dienoyl-CoA reductase-like NADH-dependent reductase (Old Yellow Enzyme family)